MEDILLSDSDMNCLSISSNDFVCGWLGADGCCRCGLRADADWKPPRGRGLCSLRGRGQRALDGKIDLSVFQPDHHDLDGLPLGQIVVDIADVSVRDLGNVDKAGGRRVQRDKCTEFRQALDGPFNNFSYL